LVGTSYKIVCKLLYLVHTLSYQVPDDAAVGSLCAAVALPLDVCKAAAVVAAVEGASRAAAAAVPWLAADVEEPRPGSDSAEVGCDRRRTVADAAAVAEVVVAVVQAADAARLGDNSCFVVVARHFADVAVVRVKHLGQVGAGAVFVVLVLQVADGCSLAEYVQ
jgi:hypothetical protein